MVNNTNFHLTPREMEIMRLVADGLENKHIATKLGIVEQTVKNHLKVAYLRLRARNRAHAVYILFGRGESNAAENP